MVAVVAKPTEPVGLLCLAGVKMVLAPFLITSNLGDDAPFSYPIKNRSDTLQGE